METQDQAASVAAAQQMSSFNPIDGVVVPIAATDLEFGLSERQSKGKAYSFTAAANGNAVRLTTDSFASGAGKPIPPLFPIQGLIREIRPQCTATHTFTTLDVSVVVDRSGSMRYAADESSQTRSPPVAEPAGWQTGDPVAPNSRWLDLVASVNSFCNELSQTAKIEKVSLCGYAHASACHQTLTDDYQLISDELDTLSANFYGGSTNVGDGILEGLASVSDPKYCRPWASNALVVMSDGNHNTGTDPIYAAGEAIKKSVPIYTVSFSFEANQGLMQRIADMTGGTHYHAEDAQQLNEAFKQIARRLPSMLTE
ncbi:vWA domain-containing protein [Aporhodopirellula aestuarii]|uniref:VWA domain-containing protein n=1 Tax=Aporhodopirellula aestuarii TaxID=2950107 RepID=A0ABT0U267_9BACT|nr:vWA domain-containing protein [Aporhodopirellula aestuarii]MCM2370962.1 VWA domain-containing protein [Aporhodopirellula aestuarii]